ncbi:MAG: zinc ribbon domain-containing protein [Clostridiales bacterium]|nr:zinc ribbon domain-containing protein [Clostridiales bacterium]
MKKGWYYLWFVVLGLLWVYALRDGIKISSVICMIILAPITFRIVRGFLTVVSNEKSDDNNIANDFEPLVHQNPEQPEGKFVFCSECGTKNAADAKFCASCGNPLQNQ